MDISTPIRTLLRQHLAGVAPGDTLLLLAHTMAFPEAPIGEVPAFFSALAAPAGADAVRAQGYLALAGALRIVPRIARPLRAQAHGMLRPLFAGLQQGVQQLLVDRGTPAYVFLWNFYLLTLGRERLALPLDDATLKGLWRRGWGAYARGPRQYLHPQAGEGSLDGVIYQDLLAMHAAYNAAALLREPELLAPMMPLVKWHVETTQPDHVTTEPWALAGFACLDETQTFAGQQLHDASARLQTQKPAVVLALLADALLTQEEAAQ